MSLSQRGGHATSDAGSDPASLLRPSLPLALVPLLSLSQISVRKAHRHQSQGKLIPESPSRPPAPAESPGVGSLTPAQGAGPSPPGLLRAHQLPRALSSPHTLDNLDNLPPTFHTPGASHTQRVAKQPPQLSHWHRGTSPCPPGLGRGSGQSWPRRTAVMGAHPRSPQAFGEEMGCFGLVQCPVLWRPVHGDHVLLH